MPLGEVWGDTLVQVPQGNGRHVYRNLFSHETVKSVEHNDKRWFRAAELFRCFPVAVLVR